MYECLLDIGEREDQQDNCAIFEKNSKVLLALADGMGGHKGGALASQIFINEAKKHFDIKTEPKQIFENIINSTKQNIIKEKEKNSSIDPHTTCVLAFLDKEKLHFAHIGDSRLYFFENKKLIKRTKDHSIAQIFVGLGEITEEEVANHPDQSKIFKSICANEDVSMTYESINLDEKKDFFVLLCSDGLWECINEQEMIKFLSEKSLKNALKKMVAKAKQKGKNKGDNISVAVYKHERESNPLFSKILKYLKK